MDLRVDWFLGKQDSFTYSCFWSFFQECNTSKANPEFGLKAGAIFANKPSKFFLDIIFRFVVYRHHRLQAPYRELPLGGLNQTR